MRTWISCITLIALIGCSFRLCEASPGLEEEILKARLQMEESGDMSRFYQSRGGRLAWVSKLKLNRQGQSFLHVLREADREGLRPEDYLVPAIEELIQKERSPETAAELDLLMTKAFLTFASDLSQGRVRRGAIETFWTHFRDRHSPKDLLPILNNALVSKKLDETLRRLGTSHPGYADLRKILAHYRETAADGGWQSIPGGPKLKLGDQGPRVVILRQRLSATGDLPKNGENDLFDETLEEALKRFQRRHGLEEDGMVGAQTLVALNVPVEDRIRQLELNMERRRWFPDHLGERRVMVDLPDFHLKAFEKGRPTITMKVVAGKKKDWQTPTLDSQITNLILNPKWHVPPDIIEKEMVDKLKEDPTYFAANDMVVTQVIDGKPVEVDPTTVDWSKADTGEGKLRIVQRPGAGNALGRIKFMFPNPFAVYLHDTPQQSGFQRNVRALSHGCVRLEKPLELADFLLEGDPHWNAKKLRASIANGDEMEYVPLARPADLYILYWTAWVDENGVVQFRNDIYDLDKKLDKAMKVRPASARNP